ncbi:MAG: helix-turn-helix transcriptional regulator [Clostridia bacterium]|nr:helix-turn-helix transcriptional regulator [Clostridia bacterium]
MFNLKYIRETYTNLSGRKFAKILEIPYTTYMHYEDRNTASLEVVIKISKYLNMPIDALVNNDVNLTPKQQEALKLVLSLNEENVTKIIERATLLKEMELNNK